MGASIREIPLHRTTNLELFRDLDHFEPVIDELKVLGHRVSDRLATRRVWMLNSTASGGGVAEMMPRVCSLLADLGVDTRWLVLDPGRPDFFPLTKALHNMLHGEPGFDHVEGARSIYEAVSAEAAADLHRLSADDLLVVHDPQPAGVPSFIHGTRRPRTIWRCHIGVPERNEQTREGWSFLHPYLEPFGRLLFSAQAYVPAEWLEKSAVLYPGIDPLAHKNRDLRPYKLAGILRSSGMIDGPDVPRWARFHAPIQRWSEGEWIADPIPGLIHVPLVVQVSRFDRLKGFQYLIPAFAELARSCHERALHVRADAERVESELLRAQLILAGPDPAGVTDDPQAAEVLAEICAQQNALPESLRMRVHVLRLPMVDVKENALMVNALQRIATVVVQNSVREGFGLTVAEALWKGTPVVASNVGGIAVQIRHGTDGILVDDPCDSDAVADALMQMLAAPMDAERMGRAGRRRVRDHFLVLSQVRRWLEEIDLALQRSA